MVMLSRFLESSEYNSSFTLSKIDYPILGNNHSHFKCKVMHKNNSNKNSECNIDDEQSYRDIEHAITKHNLMKEYFLTTSKYVRVIRGDVYEKSTKITVMNLQL